ncbi:d-amino acid [Colletotrichum karsti]|uniref:D-amino acid n=1 Tax=Colletotrichum karsti TaxID=1095194 RepID=A0A9P6LJF9_9PEZI|nr:d-amino acid [Colletotrichum karsti]KAF9874532.1 d-amino acid [Colletotrichum karsti]
MSKLPPASGHFVVLGAGVIGLSTAITLRSKFPSAQITIVAEYFPGDYHIDYCSPWAGANWCSSANDNGLLESFDRVTFQRFQEIAKNVPEAGIKSSPLRMIFDQKIEDAGILSSGTGKLWYDDLVGGAVPLKRDELPEIAVFGLDLPSTFVINSQIYLQWLLEQCRQGKVTLLRRRIKHIKEGRISPDVKAIFNCTGLGSYHLGGVEDKAMYPTRGQTVLVEQPIQPLKRMYFRSPRRVDNDTTYVFQRPLAGGIVLGGCRQDGNWDKNVDPELAKTIMERCCALAPELGRPEDLKVIKHGVGLRPGRKGGPRIEVDQSQSGLVVHNYGASGAGYQASWGMAAHAVKLAQEQLDASGPTVAKL